MAGIQLNQPNGAGILNAAGDSHPDPVSVEAGLLCQLSTIGLSTARLRWVFTKPGGSASTLSSSTGPGPSFLPDVDGGAYSIHVFDIEENEYILDIVTATTTTTPGGSGTVATSIATYADVRAVAAFSTTTPRLISIQCREFADDSGGGLFAYDPDDTTTEDNDITVLVGASGERYKRIYSGPIDVRWAGARETTDSVAGFNSRAAIQACLDLDRNSPYGGNWVLIPPPSRGATEFAPFGYRCDGPLHIKQSTVLDGGHGGSEYAQTRLWFPAGSAGIIVDPRDFGADVNGSRTTIRNLMLIATSKGSEDWLTGGADAIRTEVMLELDNVFIFGWRGHGVNTRAFVADGQNADQFLYKNVRVAHVDGRGFWTHGSEAQAGVFLKCEITSTGREGFCDQSALGNSYFACNAITGGDDETAGTTWSNSMSVTAGQVVKPTVSNGHFYVARNSGTAGSSEPLWQVASESTTVSGAVTFTEAGTFTPGTKLTFNIGGAESELASNASRLYGCYSEEDSEVRVMGQSTWDGTFARLTDDSSGAIMTPEMAQNFRMRVGAGPRSAMTSLFNMVLAPYDQSETFLYILKSGQSTDFRLTYGTGGGAGYRFLWAFSQPYMIFSDETFTRNSLPEAGGGGWCIAHRGLMYNSWDRVGSNYSKLHFQARARPHGTGTTQEANFVFQRGDSFEFDQPSAGAFKGEVCLRDGESPQVWSANASIPAIGFKIQPTVNNGYFYQATAGSFPANTDLTTEPTWPTGVGSTVVDNGITWTRQGASALWSSYGPICPVGTVAGDNPFSALVDLISKLATAGVIVDGTDPALDSVTRTVVQRNAPTFATAASWSIDGYGRAVCSVNTGDSAVYVLELPNGCELTSVTAYVKGTGHAALPAVMPQFVVRELEIDTNTTSAESAAIDASGSSAAFDLVHAITKSGLSKTINNTNKRYTVDFSTESGANAETGFTIVAVVCGVTITGLDRQAS